ncbi:MAG: phosphate/phosphite/phosphonate ABC transporter substrate-binding protein [Myxococcales bacterium]|nr:phosphate/phosphite/phosphonate ABC transporter substrate-binding protein [Myxococcales bacterium]
MPLNLDHDADRRIALFHRKGRAYGARRRFELRTSVLGALLLILSVACQETASHGAYPVAGIDRSLPVAENPRLQPNEMPRGRKDLRFGVTPYLGVEATHKAFTPIVKWVSERLGVPVRFVMAGSYDALVEKLARGEVDIVQLSPLSYIVAHDRVTGLRLVASSLSFGSDSYSSLLVVRTGSRLRHLQDVVPAAVRKQRKERKARGDGRAVGVPKKKKVRFGFVHERSASGFLLPYAALLSHGIDPRQDMTMVRMGSHEAAIEGLIKGKVDIAAVSSGTLNNVRRGAIIGVGNLRILHKAGRIPYDALCTSPQVPTAAAKKIAAAFGALSTRTGAGRDVLANAWGVTGWASGSDERYDFMRKIYSRVRAEEWREQGRSRQTNGLPKAASEVHR